MTFLHEKSLLLAMSVMYMHTYEPEKEVTMDELKKCDWAKNTSEDGIELFVTEAEKRNYITIISVTPTKFRYKANTRLVKKRSRQILQLINNS